MYLVFNQSLKRNLPTNQRSYKEHRTTQNPQAISFVCVFLFDVDKITTFSLLQSCVVKRPINCWLALRTVYNNWNHNIWALFGLQPIVSCTSKTMTIFKIQIRTVWNNWNRNIRVLFGLQPTVSCTSKPITIFKMQLTSLTIGKQENKRSSVVLQTLRSTDIPRKLKRRLINRECGQLFQVPFLWTMPKFYFFLSDFLAAAFFLFVCFNIFSSCCCLFVSVVCWVFFFLSEGCSSNIKE